MSGAKFAFLTEVNVKFCVFELINGVWVLDSTTLSQTNIPVQQSRVLIRLCRLTA